METVKSHPTDRLSHTRPHDCRKYWPIPFPLHEYQQNSARAVGLATISDNPNNQPISKVAFLNGTISALTPFSTGTTPYLSSNGSCTVAICERPAANDGGRVRIDYGGDVLFVSSAGGTLQASDLTADDFIF